MIELTRDKTKGIYFILAFVALFVFLQFISVISGFIANLFNYNYLDPDNIFMYMSVHHIIQIVIALITIYLITTKFKVDFNLKFILSKPGVIYTLVFIVIMCIYIDNISYWI
ncbi:MAG: hypothetical protein RR585_09320 [Coprobacillus sp.]